MRVAEYPLQQLHWVIRRDPWVQAIFLAAGVKLDELAERILDVSTFEDSEAMMIRSLTLWERILGLTPARNATMEERRAAVRALWLAGLPPSVETLQAVCDNWRPEGVRVGYEPGRIVLELAAGCGYLFPEDWDVLIRDLERVKPAHLDYVYAAAPKTRPAAPVGYMAAVWVTPSIYGGQAQPEARRAIISGWPAAAAVSVEIHVASREED